MSWDIQASDHVVTITMNTNKVNCMGDAFFQDCHETLSHIEQNYPNHSVVLTGQGSIFSAGLDVNHVMPMFARGDHNEINAWFEQFTQMVLKVFTFKQPIVAAVNGHAFAGGLILALCCEHRVGVNTSSKMSLNEIAIGLSMPSTMVEIIRHAIGTRNTERAILSHRVYENQENLELGFVHEQVNPDNLLAHAEAMAKALNPPAMLAYSASKHAIRQDALHRIESYAKQQDLKLPEIFSDSACLAAQKAALQALSA